eukprot:9793857-Heterocapsa_arctica.AAC.1
MDRRKEVRQLRVPELNGRAFPPLPVPGTPVGGRQRSPANRAGPQGVTQGRQIPGIGSQPQG